MNKNLKQFLTKTVILVVLIFVTRFFFQFPIEYFNITLFKQTAINTVFNKIAGLEVLALVAVFFGLYYRKLIDQFDHPRINWKAAVIFLILGEIIVVLYYLIRASTNYYNITGGFQLYVVWLGILVTLAAAFIFFAIAVFGLDYLKRFIKNFKKELVIAAIITIILYFLLILFQNQWLFFSRGVSNILYELLSLFYPVNYYIEEVTPVLSIASFGVFIGPPCSGIDSMFLFTAFFAALFALDHKRINKAWYALMFVMGFIGVYFVNVLRLFLLIVSGVEISPKFAVGLFHTNAGWVLFIIYFLCYYLIIRKFIYKDRFRKSKATVKK